MDIKGFAAIIAGVLIVYLIRRLIRRGVDESRAMRPRKTEDEG